MKEDAKISQVSQAQYWKAWQEQMNKLNHEIFFNTDAGKLWLKMNEERYFYGPTADPAVEPAYAFFNEGRNSFLRGVRLSAYAAMQPTQPQTMQQDIDHERFNEENGQV